MNEQEKWEKILESEGLGEELPPQFPGEQVDLGDGLGRKTKREEYKEDRGIGHSKTCPLNLGQAMNDSIDQPNSKPVEDRLEKKFK